MAEIPLKEEDIWPNPDDILQSAGEEAPGMPDIKIRDRDGKLIGFRSTDAERKAKQKYDKVFPATNFRTYDSIDNSPERLRQDDAQTYELQKAIARDDKAFGIRNREYDVALNKKHEWLFEENDEKIFSIWSDRMSGLLKNENYRIIDERDPNGTIQMIKIVDRRDGTVIERSAEPRILNIANEIKNFFVDAGKEAEPQFIYNSAVAYIYFYMKKALAGSHEDHEV